MAGSAATTVEQYLAELPPERRAVVARVRDVVRAYMPAGYVESIGWGMICWSIPLSRYPDTYNRQPLGYVCLAAQKSYYALHLTSLYMDPERGAEFARDFAASGRRLDMGKGCVRFRTLDALPLDVVGRTIARTTPDDYIAMYERARAGAKAKRATEGMPATRQPAKHAAKRPAAKKATAKKSVAKKSAAKKSATSATKRKPATKKTTARRA